ncbi:MAG: cytochrome C [Desulfomonile tiedjei]|nr:cytochrome C [Desulfomonile tiedjei]
MTLFRRRRIGLKWALGLSVVFLTLVYSSAVRAASEQASTVNELVAMFDSSTCKECHEKIYGQWEKSHHARPLMGMDGPMLLTPYLKRISTPEMPAEKAIKSDFPCFKCHLPQMKYATDAVAGEIARAMLSDDKATVRNLNITCLVCHNEKAVVHGLPEKSTVYGNKDLPEHKGYPVKKSPLLKDSLMCGQCHGLGPVLDSAMPVQCATLYGSYLHAYIPSGGSQTCQECHMKNGDHYMPPDFNQREELSARLRESLPMEVQTLAYTFHPTEEKFFPMVVVKTKITSKAGHRIPDG